MKRLFRAVLAFAMALSKPCSALPTADDPKLEAILEPIRVKYHLPALAAAIITTEGAIDLGATGVRKAGTTIPVTVDDLWHLGSDGKAMTALLAGTFVVEGKLNWDDKVISFFPGIAGDVPAAVRSVTVAQMMRHRAGLEANPSKWENLLLAGSTTGQRLAAAEWFLKYPAFAPGDFHYSNGDYVVLGAKSWEQLMRERVFGPLHMDSAGFGGTGTVGQTDQPWPHFASGWPASSNGPMTDNPAYMGPAGTIHCSMADWGKFLADQLRGGRGQPALLPAAIYQAMQTPAPGENYAFGWSVVPRGWAKGNMLSHTGSNTMNFAACWIGPGCGYGVLVCSNQGGDLFPAMNEAAEALLKMCAAQRKL
jgi:CubicO group peptidase (beta-lactamase class C family)